MYLLTERFLVNAAGHIYFLYFSTFLHTIVPYIYVRISFTREIEFMKKEEDHSRVLEERDQKYAEQLKMYQEKVKLLYLKTNICLLENLFLTSTLQFLQISELESKLIVYEKMPYMFGSGSLLEDGCQNPSQHNEQSKMREENEKETESVQERLNSSEMLISGK